jgi:hypothetical protein
VTLACWAQKPIGLHQPTKEHAMMSRPANFLRTVLLVDAATCVASGVLMTLGSAPTAGLTAIPPALLLYAGLSLFPIAAFMAVTATRPVISRVAVWLIIDGNVAWVVGSLWLMVGSAIAPNALGHAFIGAQALAVAVLAALEYAGLRGHSAALSNMAI